MTQRQALGIDISHWSRTGGVNFDKVQQFVSDGTYDFLIIKAGQGLAESVTFVEQMQGAEQRGIPHTTYYFLDPTIDINQQAKHYVNLVGTEQPSYIVDVELPRSESEGGRLPTRSELLKFLGEMERLTKKRPIIYSRMQLLQIIQFVTAAENYKLWMAQYLWDRSLLPQQRTFYRFFSDFLDDYAGTLPPSVKGTKLAKNVLLWQFSEKGDGRHYIFNAQTADPRFTVGKRSADLNISILERDAFMEEMFGGSAPLPPPDDGDGDVVPEQPTATYPDVTNQDMINIFLQASSATLYWEWIVEAGLESMAVPRENRAKLYSGPKLEDLPGLEDVEKDALLAALKGEPLTPTDQPTYPDLEITNQDMINFFLAASSINEYWRWIVNAGLESMAVPQQNRTKPYTGPKVEDLPNLSQDQKDRILAEM
ncbi:MAG: glycoside hydrolase family 25 protein [Chloroflexota bacterium]|nr:MAG: glycoside hydrolase family 25 protein [Chloroflexota bacterium]